MSLLLCAPVTFLLELQNVSLLETLQLLKYVQHAIDDNLECRHHKKRKRLPSASCSRKRFCLLVRDINGDVQLSSPRDTPWYNMHVLHPPLHRHSFHKKSVVIFGYHMLLIKSIFWK
mmetsp:Transcript_1720/g.2741  ORF Transcript_1720/g.2741 Transcript_1720/m.2741 type:complete len:117 (-) Transcript_1720:417-767(-)